MLAGIGCALVDRLADVDPVVEELVERPLSIGLPYLLTKPSALSSATTMRGRAAS